jgi:transposase-like protein
MRKRYTRAERDELIRAVTNRREPVATAAARLRVPISTAFRWLRGRAGEPKGVGGDTTALTTQQPTFVELVPTRVREARVVVRAGGAEIEVRTGFDAELLRAVVAALRGAEA